MASWGTSIGGVKEQVNRDFEPSVGQAIEYQSDGFGWAWQSPESIVSDIVKRTRSEGHEPLYVRVDVTGNYLIGFTYNTTLQLRVKHSSPVGIAVIVLAVIVLLIVVVVYFTADRFYAFAKEEPLLAGGLILAGVLLLGFLFMGRLPKMGKEGET